MKKNETERRGNICEETRRDERIGGLAKLQRLFRSCRVNTILIDNAFIYLFLLASRAALIRGDSVLSDSAFWKNACCGTHQNVLARVDEETHLEQLGSVWSFLRIDLERLGKVVFEHGRERLGVRDGRCAVGRNQIERL
jgi:hypothetical protein